MPAKPDPDRKPKRPRYQQRPPRPKIPPYPDELETFAKYITWMCIEHFEACERDCQQVYRMLKNRLEDMPIEEARRWEAFGDIATKFLGASERHLIEALLRWGKPGDLSHAVITGDKIFSAVNLDPEDEDSKHQLIMVHLHDTEFLDTM